MDTSISLILMVRQLALHLRFGLLPTRWLFHRVMICSVALKLIGCRMSERISHSDMAFAMQKMLYSKELWVKTHGAGKAPRPSHEVEEQRSLCDALRQAVSDYSAAASRDRSAA